MYRRAGISIQASRRAYPRHEVGIVAVLMTNRSELVGVAKVQNMSGGGAKLILSDQVKEMPDLFVMALGSKSGPRRSCCKIWQRKNVVGVRFITADETLVV